MSDVTTMAPVPNPRVLFKEIPEDYPVPGKSTVYDESQTINPDTVPLNGGFLLKILQLSLDPYMRSRMRDPSIESYVPAFVVDQPLENWGIAVVVRSEHPEVKAGEHLLGFYPYQHYVVMQEPKTIMDLPLEKVDKRVMPPEAYLGPCGLPGQTAYYGWKEYAKPKKGDVAFVTTAGGPVGSVVVQLAKADGLKVIASAGSDEKVAWVKEIGADVAFNYKTTDVRKVLEKEGPINIYWDNVGGEQLEAAIDHAARDASFIECGMASDYNTTNPYHVKNLVKIVTQSLQLHGFVYFYLAHKHIADFRSQYVPSVASGDIKYRTWAVRGLENAQQALVDVLSGRNFGKAILVVADE